MHCVFLFALQVLGGSKALRERSLVALLRLKSGMPREVASQIAQAKVVHHQGITPEEWQRWWLQLTAALEQ
jgi:hypothetical protein